MKMKILVAIGVALVLLGAAAAYLHAPAFHTHAGDAIHGGGASSQSITLDAQPGTEEFRRNPHVRAFYELTVQEFAGGPDNVDLAGFEQKSFAIFRSLGESMGASPEAMQDHLKDIPRQMIGIVKDDPHTLDNYDNFAIALLGPP
jgi:hypothetical protein